MAVNSFNAQNPPVNTKGDLFTFSTIPTKLAVGSNNTVLTADSTTATGLKWATPATSGVWTQVATGSMTGSTVTVSGLSGKAYAIFFDAVSASGAGTSLRIRFNSDSGSNYYPISTGDLPEQTGSSGAQLNAGNLATAASTYFGFFYIPFAADGHQGKIIFNQGNGVFGAWKSTSAITSISFLTSAGTFDAGTYYVWSMS